jgi:hypothetical protein
VKVCSTCSKSKELEDFHKKSSNTDGLDYDCKLCANKKSRDRRSKDNNKNTKVYERTKKGKLVRTYRNMLSRVKGILKNKAHLYEGLDILDKDLFYKWSLNDSEYNKIFDNWVNSNYDLKVSPSIDRILTDKGYTLDNIRWITFSENCSIAKH